MVAQLPKSEIIYPDSDGKPTADNTLQFNWIVMIKQNLEWLFHDRGDVFVAGDLLWYPVEGQPETVCAPDVMVAFGRPKGDRGSYKQWLEGGIAPQVVFEILSPSNRPAEMARKLIFYDRFGVEEYYLYDPDRFQLSVFVNGDGTGLLQVEEVQNWVSPRLQVRFDLSLRELQLFFPDGSRFFSFLELNDRLAQERQRAGELEALLAQYRARFGELP
jgi:Uma2 family endonuclease